jgi:hypothetical protein
VISDTNARHRGCNDAFVVRFLAWVWVVVLVYGGTASANPVDDARAIVVRLERRTSQLHSERAGRLRAYAERVDRVAALKAQSASFGRDRKLQALLAESRDLATALDQVDAQLVHLSVELGVARGALLVAIDRELGAGGPRREALQKERAALTARLGAARRLKIPDETISPNDDAEDLAYKAGALRQAEEELRAEQQRLLRLAGEYRRQARLIKSRARADDQDVFADSEPHRSAGKRAEDSPIELAPETSPGAPPPPAAFAAGLAADPTVVLAEVVDAATLDELRRAEGTHEPSDLAAAAERAAQALTDRADRLRKHRLEMERRARLLRGERP